MKKEVPYGKDTEPQLNIISMFNTRSANQGQNNTLRRLRNEIK